jgi:nitrite reductase/ring-hydroxylating ferredoxin subunit
MSPNSGTQFGPEIELGPQSSFDTAPARIVEHSGKIIAVIKRDDRFFAVEERCPHRAGPMSESTLSQGKLVCPWHGAEFHSETGAIIAGPAKRCLGIHKVFVRDGLVVLQVNEAVPT